MFIINRIIVIFILLLSPISIVNASPTCTFIKFSDTSSYSKLDTADLLSDLLVEQIVDNNIFSVKEAKTLNEDANKMYIEDYEEMNAFKEGESTGNFDAMFNDSFFGTKKSKKIYEAVQGEIVYPDIIKNISSENNVSYIIHGTVKKAVSYDTSSQGEMTFHKWIVDFVGANEKNVEVIAYVRIIEGDTGKVIWGNDVKGVGSKLNVSVKEFTFGGKHYDSAMYFNAVNKAVENIVKNIQKDIAAGNLILKDRGE